MDRPGTTAEGCISPVTASLNNIIEKLRIIDIGIVTKPNITKNFLKTIAKPFPDTAES